MDTFGDSFRENMVKECEEEASLPASLSKNIKSAGQVTFPKSVFALAVFFNERSLVAVILSRAWHNDDIAPG